MNAAMRDEGKGKGAVVLLTAPAEVEGLLTLFESIAEEMGWRPGDQLRAHRDRSTYFAATIRADKVGGLQLVSGVGRLPCQAVWPEVAAPVDAAEILILALSAPHRAKSGLLWPLCVAMWRYCVDEGITALLLEATPPTLAVYRRLGFPLEVVGELREHWGEPCHLCRMGVAEVADALTAKAARSRTYRDILALASRGDDPPLAVHPAS